MTPELGIIEGYFGRCWTWDQREKVIAALAPAGYKFFHYAPKMDAHLRRHWQELHNPEMCIDIAAFGDRCRLAGMRFGIGLTPYGAHLDFNAQTKIALAAKLKSLDALGIDDLVILFDDMRGDIPDLAQRQADIMAYCIDRSRAARFFFCPSYYSNDPVLDRVFGNRPKNYLETLGRLIDPAVQIYWTGEEVCSAEYSPGHLRNVSGQLGRNISLWDNYPVNDGPRLSNYLNLRGATGRSHEIAPYISAHAINPASQPTLTCIPALTLAARYAQGADYCYGEAFMVAATQILGAEFATLLRGDILAFQNTGRDRLGERLPVLRARYAEIDHAAAREIVDWLDGGYVCTGEMLQTQ